MARAVRAIIPELQARPDAPPPVRSSGYSCVRAHPAVVSLLTSMHAPQAYRRLVADSKAITQPAIQHGALCLTKL